MMEVPKRIRGLRGFDFISSEKYAVGFQHVLENRWRNTHIPDCESAHPAKRIDMTSEYQVADFVFKLMARES
jgi:hypothetical protein